MRTKAHTTTLILFDEVELLDVAGLLQVLSTAGRRWNFRPFKVFASAAQKGLVTSRGQLSVMAEHALGDCPEPEIVLVPGGYGARRAAESAEMQAFLAQVGAKATLIGAVGYGTLMLGAAGLLASHEVAVTSDTASILSPFAKSTTINLEAPVITSGKVITAARSAHSIELALAIVSKVLGKKLADGVAAELGYALALESNPIELIVPSTEIVPRNGDR